LCNYGYCVTDVRWLRGKVLKRVFDLKNKIFEFTAIKGKKFEQLNDSAWKNDFAYITDIILHLNELNLRLQRRNQLIHNLFDHIKSFENKLLLWEILLTSHVHLITIKMLLNLLFIQPETFSMLRSYYFIVVSIMGTYNVFICLTYPFVYSKIS